jgi:hypothetical protein
VKIPFAAPRPTGFFHYSRFVVDSSPEICAFGGIAINASGATRRIALPFAVVLMKMSTSRAALARGQVVAGLAIDVCKR